MAAVPAFTTAIVPRPLAGAGVGPTTRARGTGKWRASGTVARTSSAASGETRVASTVDPPRASSTRIAAICSGVLPSPRTTSGKPVRRCRCVSACAKPSARKGSSRSPRTASSTGTRRAATDSSRSRRRSGSMGGDYLDLAHEANARENREGRDVEVVRRRVEPDGREVSRASGLDERQLERHEEAPVTDREAALAAPEGPRAAEARERGVVRQRERELGREPREQQLRPGPHAKPVARRPHEEWHVELPAREVTEREPRNLIRERKGEGEARDPEAHREIEGPALVVDELRADADAPGGPGVADATLQAVDGHAGRGDEGPDC